MRNQCIRGLSVATSAILSALFWNAGALNARPGAPDKESGFVLAERIQGNTNDVGTIAKLETEVGYKFNRHLEINVGVPFYLVRPSSESPQGAISDNGIGNAYFRLKLRAGSEATTFVSSLTGSAPTGDAARGFSTGRATVDWNNYLGFGLGRITPFGNVGLANSISDTRFFTKPFTSLGNVAHFEAGADIRVWRIVSVGASAYADAPFGQQKVYSKLVGRAPAAAPGRGASSGRSQKRGVFEERGVTVGSESIAQDKGGSVWLDITPNGVVDFELGYSRSTEYDLNSVFFSIGLNLGDWIRSKH